MVQTDDAAVIDLIQKLQEQFLMLEALKASPVSTLNRRALAIAATELETAMLWIANARP